MSAYAEVADFCLKYFGRPLALIADAAAGSSITVSLPVAQAILELMGARLAEDIEHIRLTRRSLREAHACSAVAEAEQKIAAAAKASREATLHQCRDAEALAVKEAARLQNAKTEEEIRAIKSDAESRKIAAVSEARSRIIEAIAKLKQEGGDVMFSEENLKAIINNQPN